MTLQEYFDGMLQRGNSLIFGTGEYAFYISKIHKNPPKKYKGFEVIVVDGIMEDQIYLMRKIDIENYCKENE